MAINGMDCQCAAQHEGECACGCDWTTPKEARLQEINAELLAACMLAAPYLKGQENIHAIVCGAIDRNEGK